MGLRHRPDPARLKYASAWQLVATGQDVHPGDWLILRDGIAVEVAGDETFRERFEPVTGGEAIKARLVDPKPVDPYGPDFDPATGPDPLDKGYG
ncbi:hypothetical protein FRUB_10295 [Fimbriiglobus ruber]|uniref:Uncharacterized protein n=2 Tax=Fimbriiglobus ruber TaxID=1908690 RepID=A0A225D3V9_9BACT|nr:hypothetical protein FRUB_10295 [Fimbriiglobus ruber]